MYATLGLYVSWDLEVYVVVRFILFTFMVVYIYIGTLLLKCASRAH